MEHSEGVGDVPSREVSEHGEGQDNKSDRDDELAQGIAASCDIIAKRFEEDCFVSVQATD